MKLITYLTLLPSLKRKMAHKSVVLILLAAILLICLNCMLHTILSCASFQSIFSASRNPWIVLDYRFSYTPENRTESHLHYMPASFNCNDRIGNGRTTEIRTRRTYTTVTNFITSNQDLRCTDPFVTLTTHGDFRYLDNLVPLVKRWQGPISMVLYAPDSDVHLTLERIAFMRECTTLLIKEWVTFHIFADTEYFIDPITIWDERYSQIPANFCTRNPEFNGNISTFAKSKKLKYPVNVGRNIARENVQTTYVFASDLELYPSMNLIPKFFEMLHREANFFNSRLRPFVFVLPIFEIKKGYEVPNTKAELLRNIKKKMAVLFHKFTCRECHEIPNYLDWTETSGTKNELGIFQISKRNVPFHEWEPIFISTNQVPFYNELLFFEGTQDKMSQSYIMCLLNYDFIILDKAFLVHKPGIRRKVHGTLKSEVVFNQSRLVASIRRQARHEFGKREGCQLRRRTIVKKARPLTRL